MERPARIVHDLNIPCQSDQPDGRFVNGKGKNRTNESSEPDDDSRARSAPRVTNETLDTVVTVARDRDSRAHMVANQTRTNSNKNHNLPPHPPPATFPMPAQLRSRKLKTTPKVAYPPASQRPRKQKVPSEVGKVSLRIKRHSEQARIPTRGSALAAGYDLYRSDINAFYYFGGSRLISGSAQRRKLSQLEGKLSLTPKFPSWSLLARTDASPHEVALVGRLMRVSLPLLTGWSTSLEVRHRHWGWCHRRRLPWYLTYIVI